MNKYFFTVLNKKRTGIHSEYIEAVNIYKAYEMLLENIPTYFDILQIEYTKNASRKVHDIREYI